VAQASACDPIGDALEAAAENQQIALDAIEFRDPRKMRPPLESEAAKQSEAWLIMAEDKAEQRP
jgi:hypothetical protein